MKITKDNVADYRNEVIDTKGEDLIVEGCDLVCKGISTSGGGINTSGGSIDTLGGSIDTRSGHIYTGGGDINTRGGDINGVTEDQIPAIENIDHKILEAIKMEGNGLRMNDWHSCGTTHCRGGWAVHLAGEQGYALEKKIGPEWAARLIYRKSRPGQPDPDFFASNEEAMEDLVSSC